MELTEAIKNREECLEYLEGIGQKASPECVEAVRWSIKALKALRPVSREQVERMRGEWKNFKPLIECQICGEIYNRYGENKEKPFDFCPACGAPMTDEAVQMVMERLEALKDGN